MMRLKYMKHVNMEQGVRKAGAIIQKKEDEKENDNSLLNNI
jgi:hypothetical protein